VIEPALKHASIPKSEDLSKNQNLTDVIAILNHLPEDDRTRVLVERSWALVEQDLEAHGIKFFLKIFEIAPAALQLFSFKDERPLESSAGLKVHAMLVMKTVGEAVAGLKDIPALVPVLVNLATRHADFSVKQEHFPVVGQALLSTLEAGLGDNWTPEVQAAWTSTWNTVVSVMEPALQTAILEKLPEAERNRALVQSSWTSLTSVVDLEDFGVNVFILVVQLAPESLQLFSFKDEKAFHDSVLVRAYGKLLMKTVGKIINVLHDIPALAVMLDELAARDPGFELRPEHFPVLGQALLSTLQNAAGGLWSPEMQAAWIAVWTEVIDLLAPAVVSARFAEMSDEEKIRLLVEETWRIVEPRADQLGTDFFLRLFQRSPSLLELFSFKDDKPLSSSPRLRAHGSKVMATIANAVSGLRDLEALIPILANLAKKHAEYGVQEEHFPYVGEALLGTLADALGTDWTPDVQTAWTTVWNTVVAVMAPALQRAQWEKV